MDGMRGPIPADSFSPLKDFFELTSFIHRYILFFLDGHLSNFVLEMSQGLLFMIRCG